MCVVNFYVKNVDKQNTNIYLCVTSKELLFSLQNQSIVLDTGSVREIQRSCEVSDRTFVVSTGTSLK